MSLAQQPTQQTRPEVSLPVPGSSHCVANYRCAARVSGTTSDLPGRLQNPQIGLIIPRSLVRSQPGPPRKCCSEPISGASPPGGMKRSTPTSAAASREEIASCAVSMTAGTSANAGSVRSSATTSSPFRPGIIMSTIMRSVQQLLGGFIHRGTTWRPVLAKNPAGGTETATPADRQRTTKGFDAASSRTLPPRSSPRPLQSPSLGRREIACRHCLHRRPRSLVKSSPWLKSPISRSTCGSRLPGTRATDLRSDRCPRRRTTKRDLSILSYFVVRRRSARCPWMPPWWR